MKKINTTESFAISEAVGMASINKLIRKQYVSFSPLEESFTDRIQNFCLKALQSLKALYL